MPDEPLVLADAHAVGRPPDAQPAREAQRPVRRAGGAAGRPRSTPRTRTPTSGSSSSPVPVGRSRPGYDLTEEAEGGIGGPVGWRKLLAVDVAATLRILDSPKPVIAQLHGYALAGGLELAMACDLAVAAEGTKLGEPEIRYGSAPVTLLMPYLIGQKKTRELLLTGDLIDAVEAERIGLINRVVPADRLEAEVDALADRLARTPPEVMAPTKAMLNRAMDAAGFRLAVEAGLDLGAIINAADTPEQREWDAIVKRDGLKAALAWRDRRYDERLAESGRGDAAAGLTDGTMVPARRRTRRAVRGRQSRQARRQRRTKVRGPLVRASRVVRDPRAGLISGDAAAAAPRCSSSPLRLASGRPAHRTSSKGNQRVRDRARTNPPPTATGAVAADSWHALLGLSVLSVGAGAFSLAIFTDTAASTGTFAAGTVDITSSPTVAFTVTGMMPGDTNTQALTIANAGTASFRYSMAATATNTLGSTLTLDRQDARDELRHVRRHDRPCRHRAERRRDRLRHAGRPGRRPDPGRGRERGPVLPGRPAAGHRRRAAGRHVRRDLHLRRRADRQQPVTRDHDDDRHSRDHRPPATPRRAAPRTRRGVAGGRRCLGASLPLTGHPTLVVAGPSMGDGDPDGVGGDPRPGPAVEPRRRRRRHPAQRRRPGHLHAPDHPARRARRGRVARDPGRRQRDARSVADVRGCRHGPRRACGSRSPATS